MSDTKGQTKAEQLAPPPPAARPEGMWQTFAALRGEVDRLFESFWRGIAPGGLPQRSDLAPHPLWRPEAGPGIAAPAIDLIEAEKEFRIKAELPGLDTSNIELGISGDVLTLKGEKREAREETLPRRSDDALRESEAKYRTLFESIDEAFCVIELLDEAQGHPTDLRYIEVNAAFERQTGLKDIAGKRLSEVAPGSEARWTKAFGSVARTGEAKRFMNLHAATGRWYDVCASRVGGPGSRQVCVVFQDTTERRESEARQAFLLALSDALRRTEDPEGAQVAACRLLGEHLGADRCYFADIEGPEGYAVIRPGHARDGLPSIAGRVRLADFEVVASALERGETVAVSDTETSPMLDEPTRAAYRRLGVRSFAAVPLLRGGRLVWTMSLNASAPRSWTAAELALLSEVADRCWEAADRARAHQQLRESEARHRLLIESLAQASWETDADGVVVADSPSWRAYTGQTKEERLGYGWVDAIHPDDRAYAERQWRDAVASRSLVDAEFRLRAPDGGWRWTNVRAAPVLDAQGRVEKWVGMNIDIEARHRVEAALHEREAWLAAQGEAFEAALAGAPLERALSILVQGTIAQLGEGVRCAFFAADQAKATLRPLTANLMPGADSPVLLRIAADALDFGRCAYDGAAAMTADVTQDPRWQGSLRLAEQLGFRAAWAFPVETASGEVIGVLGALVDSPRAPEGRERRLVQLLTQAAAILISRQQQVEERERAEAALRHSQKMEVIGQLTGGVAHDFNNMLQAILGGLDLARVKLEDGQAGEAPASLQLARDAALRAAALSRRLLAFARPEPLAPRPVDPNRLIRDMAELLQRTIGPGIVLVVEPKARPGQTRCDPTELENAILNLCINARDAMPRGGTLRLTTEDRRVSEAEITNQEGVQPGEFVVIRIQDSGTGMSPEVLQHALEPFFSTKPPGEGTGLGLSQVQSFLHRSHGFLRLDSEPGQGTTARLFLPRSAVQQGQAPGRPDMRTQRAPAAGATLLLVDDEDSVRRPMAAVLRRLGYMVLEAADGSGALRILMTEPRIDLLVTDVGLPGSMDGPTLVEAAWVRLPGLPVLFTTGFPHFVPPPGADMVAKPFDLDTFTQRIAGLLRPPLPRREESPAQARPGSPP